MKKPARSVNRVWQLWLATPEAAAHFDPAAQSCEDRRRWARMPADGPRAEWAASRALLAQVEASGRSRSLSHSGGYAALAIGAADCPLGIDIEQVDHRRDCMRLARFAFAPEEAAQMQALDEAARRERFYTLWTLKEACIKAFGFTLFDGLRRCVFTVERGHWLARAPASASLEARVYRPRASLYLAVVSPSASAQWAQHEWPQPARHAWPLVASATHRA